jgi:hypothetical protein
MKFLSRRMVQLCALSAALCLIAGAATAETAKNQPRDKAGAKAPLAAVVADAPNARLAALIKAGGELIRNKGVASVTRITTGVYCIRPTNASGINPANSIVTLTPEFFFSALNEIKVQWATSGSGCGAPRIGVYTLADVNADGIYGFSNDVGFSIVVP